MIQYFLDRWAAWNTPAAQANLAEINNVFGPVGVAIGTILGAAAILWAVFYVGPVKAVRWVKAKRVTFVATPEPVPKVFKVKLDAARIKRPVSFMETVRKKYRIVEGKGSDPKPTPPPSPPATKPPTGPGRYVAKVKALKATTPTGAGTSVAPPKSTPEEQFFHDMVNDVASPDIIKAWILAAAPKDTTLIAILEKRLDELDRIADEEAEKKALLERMAKAEHEWKEFKKGIGRFA